MPCSDRNKVVYGIRELPGVSTISPRDSFVVETLAGTSIINFSDIIFDLDHTTFESSFNKHSTDIIQLSSSFDGIDAAGEVTGEDIRNLTNRVNTITYQVRSIVTGDVEGGADLSGIGYDILYVPSLSGISSLTLNDRAEDGDYSYPPEDNNSTRHIVPIADCISVDNIEDVIGVWIELNIQLDLGEEPAYRSNKVITVNDELVFGGRVKPPIEGDGTNLTSTLDRYNFEVFVPIGKGVTELDIYREQYSEDVVRGVGGDEIRITGFQLISKAII